MHAYPRAGRVVQRLGNILPPVSGELASVRMRAATTPGLGIVKLGVRTFVVAEPEPTLVSPTDCSE